MRDSTAVSIRLVKWPLVPALLLAALVPVSSSHADSMPGSRDPADFLPPLAPWNGTSRELAVPADHPWATPFETSGLTGSPAYTETVSWLARLAAATADVSLVAVGRSAEGRDIVMVVAARGVEHTPEALIGSGRPIVLAQAGIHPGEIDGKDAGMMLLRDMTVSGTRTELLDRVSFLFVPILNVDGHERASRYNRANQRGPEEMGWRTNARNLNLNRDYAKLETDEVRAVVAAINRWRPDLYLDLHVTDGVDVQYDVTWGATPDYGWSPHASRWIENTLAPRVNRALEGMGHVPGPFIVPNIGEDLSGGVVVWTGTPRFSNGYGAARHLATVLVENHSLKPFDRRVLGTYVFLEAVLEVVAGDGAGLRQANRADCETRPDPVVLSWTGGEHARRETRTVKAIRSMRAMSPITGGEVVRWTGEPIDEKVVFHYQNVPAAVAGRPAAYYIPAAWSGIADTLRLHGIAVDTLAESTRLNVEMYRLPGAAVDLGGSAFDHRGAAYEGRVRVEPGRIERELRVLELPAGSFRVDTDQPLGTLAVLLLEPSSPDSLFQWGFFLEILTRTEYVEAYVMEPIARAMLDEDPALAAEFRAKLEQDPDFAADERARLHWFYRRSPFFDDRFQLYPVARVLGE
jgi:murein tripeptide amidase MpaA